ncbi:lysine-specific demethylase 2B [Lingula anatina]|uniref:[histone H3]-dimethyl-L-lysine(36) demethylase n=1 Tax=Lingula anatina TaxID=7574 RepID=A0A1S3I964_LINAN|nr:lysine-specific demethylase 2B [Lingula anatina]|eukprot:XP_013394792.1 lysine-specific demethylase 2B [Lingula anatina]
MTEEFESGRKLRATERKKYTDESISDDELEGKRTFDLEDKLTSSKYDNTKFIKEMKGDEISLKYIQEHGLTEPILVKEKTGLGMRLPSNNFQVSDVKQCVGSRRMVDVMDVNTQKGFEMSMKEWVKYYETKERDRLLNVISLEFSHTRLENYVECPEVVRELDWINCVWPRHLKICQTESTNVLSNMKYPKVQKYCLMSVKSCYTDFHIDFGGTSVWYHILHGSKVFWLIPPTERNVLLYENWTLSGKQGDMFFADQVDKCQRIKLEAGYTFFIPAGWIHAVYTPDDSLVFGGNFIHSYNIPMQLRCIEVEDRVHVPGKFRYPFFNEMCWYALERYVHCVTGKTYLTFKDEADEEKKTKRSATSSPEREKSVEKEEKKATPLASESSIRASHSKQEQHQNEDSVISAPNSPVMSEHNYIQSSVATPPKSPRKTSSPASVSGSVDINLKSAVVILKDAMAENKSVKTLSGTQTPRESPKPDANGKDTAPERKGTPTSLKESPESVSSQKDGESEKKCVKQIHFTQLEKEGLKLLIEYIEKLPHSKRCVPKDMSDPNGVISAAQKMLSEHLNDDQAQAITGELILKWPESAKYKKLLKVPRLGGPKTPKIHVLKKSEASNIRRRRTRCKRCEPCTRDDCRECHFCKDMRKYGGPGRMKQTCVSRQCMAPILPHTSTCMICGKDERLKMEGQDETTTSLMECGICWEIVHPTCLRLKEESLASEGVVNEDLPNSWECPKCCDGGKQGLIRPRILKGGLKRESRAPSREEDGQEEGETSIKQETMEEGDETASPVPISNTDLDKPAAVTETQVKTRSMSPQKKIRLTKDSEKDSPTQQKKSPGSDKPETQKDLAKQKKKSHVNEKGDAEKDKDLSRRQRKSPVNGKGDVQQKKSPTTQKTDTPESKRTRRLSPSFDRSSRSCDVPRRIAQKDERRSQRKDSQDNEEEKLVTREGRKRKENTRLNEMAPKKRMRETSPLKSKTSPSVLKSTPTSTSPTVTRKRSQREIAANDKKHEQQNATDESEEEEEESQQMLDTQTTRGRYDKNVGKTSGIMGTRGLKNGSKPASASLSKDPKLKVLKVMVQRYVVRNASLPLLNNVLTQNGTSHVLDKDLWLKVFLYLKPKDLCACMLVCKAWNCWCCSSTLWTSIDLNGVKIRQVHLQGIVRRQPNKLNLGWTNVNRRQLFWLIGRLPHLKSLSLGGNSWSAVSALCSSQCPYLEELDLQWTEGLKDGCLQDLLSPVATIRPGVNDKQNHLFGVTKFSLVGTDISDNAVKVLLKHMPRLSELDLSLCVRLTDEAIMHITAQASPVRAHLVSLRMSSCPKLTSEALNSLTFCPEVRCLDFSDCKGISNVALKKFAALYSHRALQVTQEKVVMENK